MLSGRKINILYHPKGTIKTIQCDEEENSEKGSEGRGLGMDIWRRCSSKMNWWLCSLVT
tara:strand:- start:937 stop:1113 length:177 start_codon:yes stop_codon:yes gene_type:complete